MLEVFYGENTGYSDVSVNADIPVKEYIEFNISSGYIIGRKLLIDMCLDMLLVAESGNSRLHSQDVVDIKRILHVLIGYN